MPFVVWTQSYLTVQILYKYNDMICDDINEIVSNE